MKPKEIDLRFKIDEKKIMQLDLPVEEIDISEIIDNAKIAYLEKEGTDDWNLSPAELLKNWQDEPTHARRVEAADLDFPICIYKFKGRWIILDGVHRFTKALKLGNKEILVKKATEEHVVSCKL
jgi:hypothetical protein